VKYDRVKRLNTNRRWYISLAKRFIYKYIIYITCVDARGRDRGKTSCCIICRFRIIFYARL